jgi:sortase A
MSRKSVLMWSGRLLIAAGMLALLIAGFFYLQSALFQSASNRAFDRLRAARRSPAASQLTAALDPGSRAARNAARVPTGAEVGRIQIPSLHLSAIILQGTGAGTLRLAVGHYPSSALPGEGGNVVLAGHRDTFFRPLRHIRRGDRIILETPRATLDYRVETTAVVNPNDVAVLAPTAGNILTLVTCFPFYYIGPAPHRFIVRAKLVPRS